MQSTKWVYKIQPHSSVDTRYTFPIPIPASHTFFLSELDYKDGFVHMSTAQQVPKVLDMFYTDTPQVTLLRIEIDKLSAFKRVTWDETKHGESECVYGIVGAVESLRVEFPHLHAHLEGENVESFKDVVRGEGEKGWSEALSKSDIKEWLV